MQTIGSRLKVWREAKLLKQADAANVVGLSSSTYQNYERDVRAPNAEGLDAFVRSGINANWLLTGEGPMLLTELQAPVANGPRMDRDRLRQAMKAMEKGLTAGGITMPPGKKAELLLACYDMLEEPGVTESKVINLVKAAAASLYME